MKDLAVEIEETYCKIIPHIAYSLRKKMCRIVKRSYDTDEKQSSRDVL